MFNFSAAFMASNVLRAKRKPVHPVTSGGGGARGGGIAQPMSSSDTESSR